MIEEDDARAGDAWVDVPSVEMGSPGGHLQAPQDSLSMQYTFPGGSKAEALAKVLPACGRPILDFLLNTKKVIAFAHLQSGGIDCIHTFKGGSNLERASEH